MHRLRAWLGGYFWIACPLCGRPFGGHEWGAWWLGTPHGGRACCPRCKDRPGVLRHEEG